MVNLPLPFFGGNYPIFLLHNIYYWLYMYINWFTCILFMPDRIWYTKHWGQREFSRFFQRNGKLPLPRWKCVNSLVITIYDSSSTVNNKLMATYIPPYLFRICVSFWLLNAVTKPWILLIVKCDDAVEAIVRACFIITPNLRLRFLAGVLIHKLFRPKAIFSPPMERTMGGMWKWDYILNLRVIIWWQ